MDYAKLQIDGDKSALMAKVTVPFPIDADDEEDNLDVSILTQQATAALKESVGMLCKSCNRTKNQCGKERNRKHGEICLPRFNFEEADVGITGDAGGKIHIGAAQVTARLVPIARGKGQWTDLTPSPITFFHQDRREHPRESGNVVIDTGRIELRLRARVSGGRGSAERPH